MNGASSRIGCFQSRDQTAVKIPIMLAVDIMFRGFENFVAKRLVASRIWSFAMVLLITIGTILVVLYELDLPDSAAFPGKPF